MFRVSVTKNNTQGTRLISLILGDLRAEFTVDAPRAAGRGFVVTPGDGALEFNLRSADLGGAGYLLSLSQHLALDRAALGLSPATRLVVLPDAGEVVAELVEMGLLTLTVRETHSYGVSRAGHYLMRQSADRRLLSPQAAPFTLSPEGAIGVGASGSALAFDCPIEIEREGFSPLQGWLSRIEWLSDCRLRLHLRQSQHSELQFSTEVITADRLARGLVAIRQTAH